MKKTQVIRIGLAVCLWFCLGKVKAQDAGLAKNFTNISFKICYGFIADVNKNNDLLIRSHITPFELTFSRPISKKYSWQKIIPVVEKGISIKFINLQNPEYLGNLYSIAPFVKATLWHTRFWDLRMQSSLGLAYVSKIYNRTENYRNTFFGSHLNASLSFGLENSFQISNFLALKTGIDFSHFSNGESTQPNDGMNIGDLFFSASYRFIEHKPASTRFIQNNYEKTKFTLLPVIGWKDILPVQSRKYLTAALSVEYGHAINQLQKIGVGAVMFYDGSIRPLSKIQQNEDIKMRNSNREFATGLYLFHDIDLYPLIIHIEGGYYLIDDRIEYQNRIFNRFGVRYFITKNLFFNLTHKSHFFFKGDNLEWGIGFIL